MQVFSYPQFSPSLYNAKDLYLVECKPCPVCDKTCRTSPHLDDRLWACQIQFFAHQTFTGQTTRLQKSLTFPRILLQAAARIRKGPLLCVRSGSRHLQIIKKSNFLKVCLFTCCKTPSPWRHQNCNRSAASFCSKNC